MDKAGIEKPSNPHHYRHSRASHLANHMTKSQLCLWFGWVQGSDVPARYVHLSGRDIAETYDALYGEESTSTTTAESSTRECPRCGELNRQGAKWCDQCGMDLTREQAEPEPTDPMDQMLAIVEDHPETAQMLIDAALNAAAETVDSEADGESDPMPAARKRVKEHADVGT